jgi:hypothetical protein
LIFREFAVGVSKLSGFIEWVTEGKGEIKVVLDAESQALKWQSMIVLEKAVLLRNWVATRIYSSHR